MRHWQAQPGYGTYYKSNADLSFLTTVPKRVNIFGSYTFAANKTFHNFTTDRKINFDDTLSDYHTDYNSIQRSLLNVFGIKVQDFYLSSTQTIGFFVNGSISDDNITKDNDLTVYEQVAV